MADGSIIIDTKLNTKEFETGLAKMGAITAKGAAAITAAVGSASLAAIKIGSDFEEGMSKVSAISGATADDLAVLTDKAEEMGAKTKFSATESAEALEYMAMAGWKTEDMLSGIEGIMNLAAASGENLGSVSDIVTDAMTAFGLSAQNSGHFADVLAAASSNANTNVGMMGATFKYVAPIAGAMGYSIEDTATAIGVLANAGIKGEQAGTALRSMFTRLADPPKDAADAIEELGIEVANSDGSMRALGDVISQLRSRFSELSESEQTSAASALAGTEAMSGLLALVNAGDADFEKLTSAINHSDGAAKNMADVMQDNLKGQLTALGSSLEGLGIKVYDKFAEPMKKAVKSSINYINDLTKSVTNGRLAGGVDKVADSFGKLSAGLAKGAVKVLPKVIDGFVWVIDNGRQITAVIAGIVSAVAAFKSASILTPVIASWQTATLSIHLYAMGSGAATLSQAALNGTLTVGEVLVAGLTGKIGIVTAAQALWNATVVAHPLGALAVAVGVVVTGIVLLMSSQDEESKRLDEMNEKIREQEKAWYDCKNAAVDKQNTDLAEIENTKQQWEELKTLVDEQGNLIGNKERAKQLVEEINKLAPDSIKWLDQERIGYENSATAIDNLIKKKQAQIILDSEEEGYRAALTGIREKEMEQAELGLQISEKKQNLEELEVQRLQALGEGNEGLAIDIAFRKKVEEDSLNELQSVYTNNESLLKQYYQQKAGWEDLSAAVTSDNYSKMERIVSRYGVGLKSATNTTETELAKQVAITGTKLQQTRQRFSEGYSGITEETVRQTATIFTDSIREYEKAGGSLVDGVTGGWEEREQYFLNAVADTVNKANAVAKKAGEIRSPSKLMAREVGKPLAQGVGVGFEDSLPDIYRDIQSAVNEQTGRLSANVAVTAKYGATLSAPPPPASATPQEVTNNNQIYTYEFKVDDIATYQAIEAREKNRAQQMRQGVSQRYK